MAVYRNEHLAPLVAELDQCYRDLREILVGIPPDAGLCTKYHYGPKQFEQEHKQISVAVLEERATVLRTKLTGLKRRLKEIELKPVHKP